LRLDNLKLRDLASL